MTIFSLSGDSNVPQATSISIANQLDRRLYRLNRRLSLIRTLAFVLGSSALSMIILGIGLLVLAHNVIGAVLSVSSCGGLVAYILVYFLARPNVTATRANLASYFLLSGAFISIFVARLAIGVQPNSLMVGFVVLPILAGIVELGQRAIVAVSFLAAALLAALYTTQILVKAYIPDPILEDYPLIDMFIWLILLSIVAVGICVFTERLHKAALFSDQQNEHLSHLLATLNTTNRLGVELSNELSSVAAELSATSLQQASSSREQAASVTQVTSSLTELSVTANQIAASASASATSAVQTVSTASQVKQASQLAEASASRGKEAVEQVVSSIQEVHVKIEQLGERLLELSEQNRKASTIIDLIEEIADETHILALNASIEAAVSSGSNLSEVGNETRIRGERFGVIAQEVKNLSDRSRQAAKEVRQTITEIRGAVGTAVMVAEESKKETALAVSRSHTAGEVIDQLSEVVMNSAQQADWILTATEAVKQYGEEIRAATMQQHSTNEQILGLMQGVNEVSQQNAQAVHQLSQTSVRVYQQIDQLNAVLAQTNQSRLLGQAA